MNQNVQWHIVLDAISSKGLTGFFVERVLVNPQTVGTAHLLAHESMRDSCGFSVNTRSGITDELPRDDAQASSVDSDERSEKVQHKVQHRNNISVHAGSSSFVTGDGSDDDEDERKPQQSQEDITSVRDDSSSFAKATSGIRTPDLCFTKALLYR